MELREGAAVLGYDAQDGGRARIRPSMLLLPQLSSDRGGNLCGCVSKRWIRNVNAAFTNTFTVLSDVRAMLRAVAINLTNTPQFAEPNSVLGTTGPFVAALQ
jgi:hypothetical protein